MSTEKLSDTEAAELRAAIAEETGKTVAAADDADAATATDTADAVDDADAQAVTAKADEGAADDATLGKDGKPLPNMVPRSRLAEEAEKRREVEVREAAKDARIRELEAKLTLPAPEQASRDFNAEKSELDRRYEEEGDLTLAQYLAERDKITSEQNELAIEQRLVARESKHKQEVQQQDWTNSQAAWSNENATFLDIAGAREAMQTAIGVVDAQNKYALAPADLLARAHKVAAAMIGVAMPAATEADPAKTAAATARTVAAAKRAADASSIPPAGTGSTGNRTTAGEIDLETASRDEWAALPEHQKKKALGLS